LLHLLAEGANDFSKNFLLPFHPTLLRNSVRTHHGGRILVFIEEKMPHPWNHGSHGDFPGPTKSDVIFFAEQEAKVSESARMSGVTRY
jgi:hypothetical protein